MKSFIKNLQNKPYRVRVRILWTIALVAAVGLFAIWAMNLRAEFKNADPTDFLGDNFKAQENKSDYITVERVSNEEGLMHVFFSVKNDTNDIMNFSKLDSARLEVGGAEFRPIKLTDRQNQPFVQKILSNTTQFGIITFSFSDASKGTIIFENIYFENTPQTILQEKIEIDFEKQNSNEQLRS